jgi:eukaryotic-like serine/threonine-protein kinase
MLFLKAFGGLSLDIDGIPGTGAAQQRKTLGLLALLAAAGERGLSRDKLIASLWPEADTEHGRGLLRQACYSLRRDLHVPELFLGSIQLRLNPAVISSDVGAFAAALEENDPAGAVSFYPAPFLDGFYLSGGGEFEEWAETERARLASQFRAALETLSREAAGRGEHRVAAEGWRRLLELDPLSSNAALGLMTALDHAGERAEAIRCGEAHRELVRAELGADPPPELAEWIEEHRHVAANESATNGADPHLVPPRRFANAGELAQTLSEPEGESRQRSFGAVRRWGSAIGLAGLAAAGVLLSGNGTELPTDPNLLAIAPFDVLDPGLQIWREGLVDILSRNLDAAGPLRTVPQTVGLKRWEGRADRVSAEGFGRRVGAGLVVFGTVRRARDTVSIRATVLDLDKERAEPDLEVKGDTADIGDLADTLGVRVLQLLGRNRPIGSVRRVSIGSRSLPALKAFLYGEQFYRRGIWDSALVYYDQAITQDSTFALAFKRMGMAADWHPSNEHSYLAGVEYHRKAVVLNHGLPAKDSLQIAADSFLIAGDDATDPADLIRFRYRFFSTLQEAARRYPQDPEVWYRLGDALAHSNLPLGGTPAQALEALDRAIALDAGFAPAYEHTVEMATRLSRPDLARKYAAAYLGLNPTDVNAPSIRLAAQLLDPERSHTPETARMIDTSSSWVLFQTGLAGHLGWWADSGEAGPRLLRELITRSGTGAEPWTDTLMYHQFLAIELTYRGHLREAYSADHHLILHPNASPFSHIGDPFRALGLFGVMPESLSARTFGRALESREAWAMPPFAPSRQLRGLPWWLARGDTTSLARFAHRAGQEVSRQTSPRGKLGSRYLQAAATAYLALAREDSVEALRLLQSIPDTLCLENDCFYEKLIEARLLTSQGKAREAEVLLNRWVWSGNDPLFVVGVLEQGRIAEILGERQKARDAYQFVVDVWRHADPELASYVREARSGLKRQAAD